MHQFRDLPSCPHTESKAPLLALKTSANLDWSMSHAHVVSSKHLISIYIALRHTNEKLLSQEENQYCCFSFSLPNQCHIFLPHSPYHKSWYSLINSLQKCHKMIMFGNKQFIEVSQKLIHSDKNSTKYNVGNP